MKSLKFDEGPPPETVSNDAPGPSMVTDELISKACPQADRAGEARSERDGLAPSQARGHGERIAQGCETLCRRIGQRGNDNGRRPIVQGERHRRGPGGRGRDGVRTAHDAIGRRRHYVPLPEAIVTGPDGLSVAEAPLAGAVKVTTPPSTGSPGLFGVTLTSSAVGNAVLTGVGLVVAGDDGQGEPR